jgi:hypothetical protein
MGRNLLYAIVLLGLLTPATAWAQAGPNTNSGGRRTNNAGDSSETTQPNAQTQTRAARHSGFRSFHSFTSPPAR